MSKPINKSGIAESVHNRFGIPQRECLKLTNTILEIIKSTLASGEDVLVSGFGKFCVKDKRERIGRNPATGNDLILAPRKVVLFKWSGKLRDKVNGG